MAGSLGSAFKVRQDCAAIRRVLGFRARSADGLGPAMETGFVALRLRPVAADAPLSSGLRPPKAMRRAAGAVDEDLAFAPWAPHLVLQLEDGVLLVQGPQVEAHRDTPRHSLYGLQAQQAAQLRLTDEDDSEG